MAEIHQLEDLPIVTAEEDIYSARIRGRLSPERFSPRVIDLFCGAGGMTLGFTKFMDHVFTPVWANDFNAYAARTYNRNFGNHCVVGDIVEILEYPQTVIPEAEVVIGGPPCQGFSLLNKNRDGDQRKQLWRPFMEVVKRSGASVFVMENVPQLLESREYVEIKHVAHEMGFQLQKAKLCAADYGVPQVRRRAFIIGCNFTNPEAVFPPQKTNIKPSNGYRKAFSEEFDSYIENPHTWKTLSDAIRDLPEPVGTAVRAAAPPLDLHFGRTPTPTSLARYKAIPEEGMNRFDLQRRAPHLTPACWIRKTSGGTDLFGRLWWDRPSVTIRTEFYKPEKGRYLHPVQNRPITHREAARLQSFPDDFIFLGTKAEIAKQIGNAVPPLLAARIADAVYALLLTKGMHECRTSSARTNEAGSCPRFPGAIQSPRS